MKTYIVVQGDPTGFRFFGPFTTEEEADKFGLPFDTDWWTIELEPPIEHPEEENC